MVKTRFDKYQQKNSRRKTSIIVASFTFLIVFMSVSLAYYINYLDSQPSTTNVPIETDENKLYIDLGKGIIPYLTHEEKIYLSISNVIEEEKLPFFFDDESDSWIYTTEMDVYRYPVGERVRYQSETEAETIDISFIFDDNDTWILLDEFLSLTNYERIEGSGDKIVFIQSPGSEISKLSLDRNSNEHERRVRTDRSLQSPYIVELEEGETVFYLEEKDEFFQIMTSSGVTGYVPVATFASVEEYKVAEKISTKNIMNEPIYLVWEAVYSVNPDLDQMPEMEGVNVVSPTWFHLLNGDGDIRELGDREYVSWAHERGYHVWGLFSNDFEPDRTSEALSQFKTRWHMISQIVALAETYNLDGINIDFENVYLKDKDALTQFTRELSAVLRQNDLIVSMDITFVSSSGNWSRVYDRPELAKAVDYLIVMAYDEHWANSPVAGSVASLPWVQHHLQRILALIPAEQLVLGIPTYTRMWEMITNEDGEVELSSTARGMNATTHWLEEMEAAEPQLDNMSGQKYTEVEVETAKYKVWLETPSSLAKRVELVHKYDLAGIAVWNRGFTNDQGFQIMEEILQKQAEK